jgi:hypothetical protein
MIPLKTNRLKKMRGILAEVEHRRASCSKISLRDPRTRHRGAGRAHMLPVCLSLASHTRGLLGTSPLTHHAQVSELDHRPRERSWVGQTSSMPRESTYGPRHANSTENKPMRDRDNA